MLIREKGSEPLYAQLADIIKKKIENNEYSKGDLLPTEKEFMDAYQVSRITVRQAFAQLAQIGYIKSYRGIGTEVVYDKINEHISTVISFTEEMRRHNTTMETSFCRMEKITPSEKIAGILGILPKEKCYRLCRVRDVDGKPLVYTVTYLKNLVELPMDSKYYMESLYQYLSTEHGITIVHGTDTWEATLPTIEVQKYLGVDSGMPIFQRTRLTYIEKDKVFEYSLCYYPGNKYKYTVEI